MFSRSFKEEAMSVLLFPVCLREICNNFSFVYMKFVTATTCLRDICNRRHLVYVIFVTTCLREKCNDCPRVYVRFVTRSQETTLCLAVFRIVRTCLFTFFFKNVRRGPRLSAHGAKPKVRSSMRRSSMCFGITPSLVPTLYNGPSGTTSRETLL